MAGLGCKSWMTLSVRLSRTITAVKISAQTAKASVQRAGRARAMKKPSDIDSVSQTELSTLSPE